MQEPSHLKAALQLVLRSLRTRGEGGVATRDVPRRRVAVELQGVEVDPRRVAAYLRLVAGTESAMAPGIQPLPPTYPALWITALALELLNQAELPLPSRGLVHLESELLSLRPLYLDDRPRCRLELDRVEEHAQGLRLTLVSRCWSGGGQLCLQGSMVLLARFADVDERTAREEQRGSRGAPALQWREVQSWDLRSNLGRRYAWVSGDLNPIHLWSWSSRLFGYRRPILHGFCTEAMIAHALIRHQLSGDPGALRRLQIRFRAPLLLPARVRLEVAPKESGSGGWFRVLTEERGERPVAEGEFVGDAGDGKQSDQR